MATVQDRLLNTYLAGTVDEATYKAKSSELKVEGVKAEESLTQLGDVDPACGEMAIEIFDRTQEVA
ncbi:MAG: hypothetical protein KJ000_02685 [Pirellulaceae bacterium]|nr:hypothetical protein [Pirellulaceae bacterium]